MTAHFTDPSHVFQIPQYLWSMTIFFLQFIFFHIIHFNLNMYRKVIRSRCLLEIQQNGAYSVILLKYCPKKKCNHKTHIKIAEVQCIHLTFGINHSVCIYLSMCVCVKNAFWLSSVVFHRSEKVSKWITWSFFWAENKLEAPLITLYLMLFLRNGYKAVVYG